MLKALFGDRFAYRGVKFGPASGMKMWINRHQNWRPETGLFELGVSSHLRHMASDSDCAYDIGSHRGYYALALARLGVGRIYAFEEDESLAEELSRAFVVNSIEQRVTVISGSVAASMSDSGFSIDALIESDRIKAPDLIKMDIDGGEVEALKGMRETLSRRRPNLIVETHSADLENSCLDLLEDVGYRKLLIVDNPLWLRRMLPETRASEHNRWIAAYRSEDITRSKSSS